MVVRAESPVGRPPDKHGREYMKQKGIPLRELISTLAVVASLVFVGLEIRQNTAAQRSQTRQAISDAAYDSFTRLAESPDLAAAFNSVFGADTTSLSATDSSRAEYLMLGALRRMENVYLQHREGVFDDDILETYGFSGGVFARPQFRPWWERESFRDVFDSSFVRAFEEENNLR
jgi:hypothetical protein